MLLGCMIKSASILNLYQLLMIIWHMLSICELSNKYLLNWVELVVESKEFVDKIAQSVFAIIHLPSLSTRHSLRHSLVSLININ